MSTADEILLWGSYARDDIGIYGIGDTPLTFVNYSLGLLAVVGVGLFAYKVSGIYVR